MNDYEHYLRDFEFCESESNNLDIAKDVLIFVTCGILFVCFKNMYAMASIGLVILNMIIGVEGYDLHMDNLTNENDGNLVDEHSPGVINEIILILSYVTFLFFLASLFHHAGIV